MSTKCRFYHCEWSGSVNDIFSHCETVHPDYIREHKGKNYYDFHFDDFSTNAFLLCGPSGIYWFCTSNDNFPDQIYRGVFHIGDSEPITYTLKFGLNRDGLVEHLGPFTSHSAETSQTHDVELYFSYIHYLCVEIDTRRMRLYVGEFDDNEYDILNVEDEELNRDCVEHFTCIVCYECIICDIRFCENIHYVCLKCFEGMQERGKLRCPLCLTDYSHDYSDPDLEGFLHMVRFPDNIRQQHRDEEHENAAGPEEQRPRVEG